MDSHSFAVQLNRTSRTSQEAENFVRKWMKDRTDPASAVRGSPPLYGEDAFPHVVTFQSMIGTYSRAYLNPDEAIRDSIENAHLMRKDVGILECVENRRRLTSLLDWEIVPEDETDIYQNSLARALTRMVSRIRRFGEYKFWLMDAIWTGRSGVQHRYGYVSINNRQRMIPKPLHHDHPGWMPINGDKLVFRYDDGRYYGKKAEGAYPHQMGIRVSTVHRHVQRPDGNKRFNPEPVGDGLAVFLKPWERDTFVVHKHFIEDADYHHSFFAGSIHGVGIRSRIYWEWFLKQEAFAFLMQYLERSAGGVEVWYYPMGDNDALKNVKKAAETRMANGRNIVYFPRPMGEDASMYDFQVVEPGAVGLDIIQNIVEKYFGGRLKRYILGQVLTTEAEATGLGSGVAQAHMDTLAQIVKYDAQNLEETISEELVRYLQRLNFPETLGWHMKFRLKTEDDDAHKRLEGMMSAHEMGARIPESEVFKALGIGKPQEGDRILEKKDPMAIPPGFPGDGGEFGELGGAPGLPGGEIVDERDLSEPENDVGDTFDRYERRSDRMFQKAADETDDSPSEKQRETGNYRKGKATWNGIRVSIENPRGSTRSGTDSSGKEWETELTCHYGYILGTVGSDTDHVDVFVGRNTGSDMVFIVDQIVPATGEFDEHKCLIGFLNEEQAKKAYLSNYQRGWKGLGSITPMTVGQFRDWIKDANLKRPVSMDVEFDRELIHA
jgi:hypothetical protein